jgi:hypothetical protein
MYIYMTFCHYKSHWYRSSWYYFGDVWIIALHSHNGFRIQHMLWKKIFYQYNWNFLISYWYSISFLISMYIPILIYNFYSYSIHHVFYSCTKLKYCESTTLAWNDTLSYYFTIVSSTCLFHIPSIDPLHLIDVVLAQFSLG